MAPFGLACASAFGSHIALVAIAGLDNGQIAVERLIATVDCGRVVNPGLVRQQIEGSLLQALALATMAAPEFRKKMVDGLQLLHDDKVAFWGAGRSKELYRLPERFASVF